VPYALKQEIVDKLGDGFLFEVYGSTELGVDTVLPPEDQLRKPGSCGKPYGGIEIRIVKDDGSVAGPDEAGELFVHTGLAMDGYHHSAEQLTELPDHEWKSVGDVAYVDDEGYVYICDRKKDMIISGGVNVFPKDIEEIAVQHAAIREVAVFGVASEKWGESPFAAVILKESGSVTADELRVWINARVAARYQQLQAVVIVEDFPRSTAGKTLKRVLRDQYATQPPALAATAMMPS